MFLVLKAVSTQQITNKQFIKQKTKQRLKFSWINITESKQTIV
jgi:hypothetical protein